MSYVKYQDILDGTDGGLQIIREYYPNVDEGLARKDNKFKIRNEKTPSASVRQKEDGWFYVTDFGGDQKERHAIAICMLEEGKEFPEACAYLGSKYKIKGAETTWKLIMPKIEKRDVKDDENEGDYDFIYKDFDEKSLAVLGPYVSEIHCQEYKLHNVDYYSHVKKNEVVVITATEDYPIFCFDFGDWKKLYQPMSYEKQFRFMYIGGKPKTHWFGMDVIKKIFTENKAEIDDAKNNEEKIDNTDPRLDAAFIVSGGSDGLNLRSFGYYPIWGNSETDKLTFEEYRKLKMWCKEIYYIADLDTTGKREALKTGLEFLDINLVWLPQYLKKFKDKRGNPCKDFKDLVVKTGKDRKKFSNKIAKLFQNSLPLQFWTAIPKDHGITYHFKNTQSFHFLRNMGFGRYKDDNEKDGYVFIQIVGNFVKEIKAHVIEDFVIDFVKEQPTDLRDMIYKTQFLSERHMAKLPMIDIDFTDADRDAQYLFFRKKVWEIKPEGIKEFKPGEVDRFIWDDKVIEHEVKLNEDAPFEIFKDPHGDLDITVTEKDNMFFNYLINTSRMHWRKELEDSFDEKPQAEADAYFKKHQFDIAGPNLTDDERLEQKLHLINKIYSIGYALHKYKNESKAWCVFAMDNKLSDLGEAHGGSGKSLCYGYLNNVLSRRFYLKGRDPKLTQNDFIYHGVTEDTDYIFIDDAHQYLNFNFFFSEITGSLKVNPKNGKPYEIPFDKAPKFIITSNFTARDLDPSTERRLLYTVFSDYYHYNSSEEYNQVRQVSDDFGGKNLFRDFDGNQWNKYFNFLAYCIKFFLSHPEKINPPMDNVKKRNLISEMGKDFLDWAEVFFAKRGMDDEYLNLDVAVSKKDAYDDFVAATRSKMKTTSFKKALKAYANYNNYVFNPKNQGLDNNGRIIKKTNNGSEEFFYLDTKINMSPYLSDEEIQDRNENGDSYNYPDDDIETGDDPDPIDF